MNLLLLHDPATRQLLTPDNPRAIHLIKVLRTTVGEVVDVGLVQGPRGRATVSALDDSGITLDIVWTQPTAPLCPVEVIVATPRPQTARRLLTELTALGVAQLTLVQSQRSDPAYARSKLWTTEEWKTRLEEGAAQAFTTRLPEVVRDARLTEHLKGSSEGDPATSTPLRFALDLYETTASLGQALLRAQAHGLLPSRFADAPARQKMSGLGTEAPVSATPPAGLREKSSSSTTTVQLALGPERGWSNGERDALREAGFQLVHLGEEVLRVDTAAIAAVAQLKAIARWERPYVRDDRPAQDTNG